MDDAHSVPVLLIVGKCSGLSICVLVQSFLPAMATPPPSCVQDLLACQHPRSHKHPKLASRHLMSNKSSTPFTEIFAERRNRLLHPYLPAIPRQLKVSDQYQVNNFSAFMWERFKICFACVKSSPMISKPKTERRSLEVIQFVQYKC